MEINKKGTFIMNIIEQKQLTDTINDLVGKANGWDDLRKFFDENLDIQRYYKESQRECWDDGCYSASMIMTHTIEKLLSLVEDVENI
jgi:hypothetical protein